MHRWTGSQMSNVVVIRHAGKVPGQHGAARVYILMLARCMGNSLLVGGSVLGGVPFLLSGGLIRPVVHISRCPDSRYADTSTGQLGNCASGFRRTGSRGWTVGWIGCRGGGGISCISQKGRQTTIRWSSGAGSETGMLGRLAAHFFVRPRIHSMLTPRVLSTEPLDNAHSR